MIDLVSLIAASGGERSTNSWIMICAAIVMATIIIMRMRSRRPLDGSPKQYRREIDSANSESMAIKRSLERLLVELEELSRNVQGQIDTKFAKLEQAIMDADRRISALRILIDEAKKTEGEAAPRANPPVSSQDAPQTPPAKPSSRPPQPVDPRHQQIYGMADRGMTAVEIARDLGTTTGEIELILNLREKGG